MTTSTAVPHRRLSTDASTRTRQFRRVMRQHLALGVTGPQIAEAVNALRDGTTPDELADVLRGYVPESALDVDIPLNALSR